MRHDAVSRSRDAVRRIKDSGLGYKEGALEAMQSLFNTKTYSVPW